jgi:hypothetical protein
MRTRILPAIAGTIALAGLPATAATLFLPAPAAKAVAPAFLASASAIAVDRETVLALAPGSPLEADLPDGTRTRMTVERVDRHANGDVSWMARVHDPMRGDFISTGTMGSAGTFASIDVPGRTWAIIPAQHGHEWLFDRTTTDAALPPPPDEKDWVGVPNTDPPRAHAKATCPAVSSMPTPNVTIDILAIMGPDFIALHGGDAQGVTRINAMINEVNARYAESNIAVTFRVVGLMRMQWGPATANDNHAVLGAMSNQTGPFTQLKAVRNFYGADQVAFFRGPFSPTSFGGVAYLPGDGNGSLRFFDGDSLMFTVVGDRVGANAHTLAHELGHLLGNKHDRYSHGSDPSTGSTPYAFGHYVCQPGLPCTNTGNNILDTGTGFGTEMSYWNPVISKFSSPSLTCQGTKPGAFMAPCGVADLQDSVRATNCIRQEIADLRHATLLSCPDLEADADHDGIPDCLEANSGKVDGTRDNDVFGEPLLFAAQQYRDFLAREGDPDGLNFWATSLASGAYSGGQMIEAFFASAEFQGVIAPVARLYFAYFLRVPDYAGLDFWIGYFRSGNSLESISSFFAGSAEFQARYGALDNAAFVNLVYQNVLGRAPDAPGFEFWKGQLDTGAMSRGQVMLGFSESAEYRQAVNSEVYVTMMYMGMLRRAPEAGGFDFWVQYLDGGQSGLALIDGFRASPEYRARFLP